MKSSEENDNRYLGILKESGRLHTIKSKTIGNDAFLYIKLLNVSEANRQVQIEDKGQRIYNNHLKSLIPVSLSSKGFCKTSQDSMYLSGVQKSALVKQVKLLIKEKVDMEVDTFEKLASAISNACVCGLLSIEVNKEIKYRAEFGPRSCYRLFCYKIYSKILNGRATRVKDIERLFNLKNVANNTDIKLEENLKDNGLESKVKLIKLCINTPKVADFEAKFKKNSER